MAHNTESPVRDLARAYGERARHEARLRGPARVFIGNGEPTIVVGGDGKGGRATHLALLMAREISGLQKVSFLAAGTDDRDGSSDASGAAVDGSTWTRAEAAGLDPAAALERCDSETPLKALGCLVRGPGTSNLLDLHLLSIGS
jgi:hydroxypyruvate reductase